MSTPGTPPTQEKLRTQYIPVETSKLQMRSHSEEWTNLETTIKFAEMSNRYVSDQTVTAYFQSTGDQKPVQTTFLFASEEVRANPVKTSVLVSELLTSAIETYTQVPSNVCGDLTFRVNDKSAVTAINVYVSSLALTFVLNNSGNIESMQVQAEMEDE